MVIVCRADFRGSNVQRPVRAVKIPPQGIVRVTTKPTVTVITPVYNEAESLRAYYQAVSSSLLARQDCGYHVLFVDDGSVDRSWEIIEEICALSPCFQAIRLSRNFGSHAALSAG